MCIYLFIYVIRLILMLGVCLINFNLFDYTDIQGIVIRLHGKTILKISTLLRKKNSNFTKRKYMFSVKITKYMLDLSSVDDKNLKIGIRYIW